MSYNVQRKLIFNTDTTLPSKTLAHIRNTKVQHFHLSKTSHVDPPSHYDCRQQYARNKITSIASQTKKTCSAAIAAVHTLADRWAIWNDKPVETLSTTYISNHIGVEASLLQVWLLLQVHGTLRVQDTHQATATATQCRVGVNDTPPSPLQPANPTQAGLRSRDIYHIPDERNIKADIYNHGPSSTSFFITNKFIDFWEYQLAHPNPIIPLIYDFENDAPCGQINTAEATANTAEANANTAEATENTAEATENTAEATENTAETTLGTHSVRIVGWGSVNDTPYWILANSWGAFSETSIDQYGKNGYFLAKRGNGIIEQNAFAGFPFLVKKDTQPECCGQKKTKTLATNIQVFTITEHKLYQIGHTPPPPAHLTPLIIYKGDVKKKIIPSLIKHNATENVDKQPETKNTKSAIKTWIQDTSCYLRHAQTDPLSTALLCVWIVVAIGMCVAVIKQKKRA